MHRIIKQSSDKADSAVALPDGEISKCEKIGGAFEARCVEIYVIYLSQRQPVFANVQGYFDLIPLAL